jgi:hypothetical protein
MELIPRYALLKYYYQFLERRNEIAYAKTTERILPRALLKYHHHWWVRASQAVTTRDRLLHNALLAEINKIVSYA